MKPLIDLEEPHIERHKLIGRIIELMGAGEGREAERLYQAVTQLSEEILVHMSAAEQ